MAIKKVYETLKESRENIRILMDKVLEYQELCDSDIYSEKYKEKLKEKVREGKQEINRIKQDTRRIVQDIVTEAVSVYEEMDTPKATDLSEDVKLLNTGIRLKSAEAMRLLQKKENQNPTMRRLILEAYKTGNNLSDNQVRENLPMSERVYIGHQNEIAETKSLIGVADMFLDRWVETDKADSILDKVFTEHISDDE